MARLDQSHMSPGDILDPSWSKGRYSGLRGAAMELCLISVHSFIWAQDFLLPHLLWHSCRPLSNLLNSPVYLTIGHLLLGPPVGIILWDERHGGDPMMTSCMWCQEWTAWIHLGLLSPYWPHPGSVAGQPDRCRSEPLDLSSHCAAVLGLIDHQTSKNVLHNIIFLLSRAQSRTKHYTNFIYHVSLMSFNLKYFLPLPSFPLTLTFLDGISFIWV